MSVIKLWVDDLRPAPEGWFWVKSSQEALNLLASETTELSAVSFDHDLGGDDTTRPVALWMAEFEKFPPVVHVHTANPVGRDWLVGVATRYGPGVTPSTERSPDVQ